MQKSGIRVQIANNIHGLRGTSRYLSTLHTILTQLRMAGFKQTGLSYTPLGGVMQTMATSIETNNITEMTDAQVEGCERRIMAEVDKAESEGKVNDRRDLGIDVNITLYHTLDIKAMLLYQRGIDKLITILRSLGFSITGGDTSFGKDGGFKGGFTTLTFKLNYEYPAKNNVNSLLQAIAKIMDHLQKGMPASGGLVSNKVDPNPCKEVELPPRGGYAHQKVEFNPAKEVAVELKPGTGKVQNGIREMEFVGANIHTIRGNNTFRIGDKWADLEPGDVIRATMIDKSGRNFGGYLRVKSVFRGPLYQALQFAGTNHGVIDLGAQNSSSVGQNELLGILAKAYKGVDTNDNCVVVFFEKEVPRFEPRSFA